MLSEKLAYHARHPLYPLQRLYYAWRVKRHPDLPWLSPGAIAFLEKTLKRDHRGIEWGSGRSTVWFAKRMGHLTSVEHNEGWRAHVAEMLKAEGLKNVDYLSIPLDHPESDDTRPVYEREPRYVAAASRFADASLDFAVVDGHYRQACILAAIPKLKKGGLLLVDNTNWMPLAEWGVPPQWPMAHQSGNFLTQTTIWQKP